MHDRPFNNNDFGVKPNSFILYTNRTAAYFDNNGDYRSTGVKSNKIDTDKVLDILNKCSLFYICKYGKWIEVVDKQDIKYMLGLK